MQNKYKSVIKYVGTNEWKLSAIDKLTNYIPIVCIN